VKAVTKVDANGPTPNTAVINTSRPNPRNRDTMVAEATTLMFLKLWDTRPSFAARRGV
jgi:hypothetical protein